MTTQILRWSDPALGQNYVSGIRHFRFLGLWAWNDHPRVVAMVQAAESDSPVASDQQVEAGPNPIPDYQAACDCEMVWDLGTPKLWHETATSDDVPPLLAFVKVYFDDKPAQVWGIVCTWMAVLNDQGDTVDTLVNARTQARRRVASTTSGG